MRNATLLIVDDEAKHLEDLVSHLKPLVSRCLTARNGREAWDKLLSHEGGDVDLIVCDLVMPEMDGVELLQRVRASGSETPFVFLSHALEKPTARSLALGCCFHLEKVEGFRDLAETVKQGLNGVKRTGMKRTG